MVGEGGGGGSEWWVGVVEWEVNGGEGVVDGGVNGGEGVVEGKSGGGEGEYWGGSGSAGHLLPFTHGSARRLSPFTCDGAGRSSPFACGGAGCSERGVGSKWRRGHGGAVPWLPFAHMCWGVVAIHACWVLLLFAHAGVGPSSVHCPLCSFCVGWLVVCGRVASCLWLQVS